VDTRRKLKIPYPIIVEGKYDRLRLLNVCEAHILTTDGFGVFKASEKLALFKELSKKTPVIVLTDSDGAGKVIRSHLTSAIPQDRLIQLYIPKVEGKEKRKAVPSKEGTLGVEGMTKELLYDLLAPFEDPDTAKRLEDNPLSKTDLYIDGLTGNENSAAKRDALAKELGLPFGMTSGALLAALRILMSYDEYIAAVGRNERDG